VRREAFTHVRRRHAMRTCTPRWGKPNDNQLLAMADERLGKSNIGRQFAPLSRPRRTRRQDLLLGRTAPPETSHQIYSLGHCFAVVVMA
jgi:hypothetical protein